MFSVSLNDERDWTDTVVYNETYHRDNTRVIFKRDRFIRVEIITVHVVLNSGANALELLENLDEMQNIVYMITPHHYTYSDSSLKTYYLILQNMN